MVTFRERTEFRGRPLQISNNLESKIRRGGGEQEEEEEEEEKAPATAFYFFSC